MIAKDRVRRIGGLVVALAAVVALAGREAGAQNSKGPRPIKAGAEADPRAAAAAANPIKPVDYPMLVPKAIPANPTDPVAVINGEAITRQQLSDECVARRGLEILDTLIARKLIEQAIKAKKLTVTPAEIDAEIDNVAHTVGHVERDVWLRTLDKERGISPIQYARDIIYPSIALRKLASPRVQVTPEDLKSAFEAYYGEKLRCRMILVDKPRTAQEIWHQLKQNPDGFEAIAKERSIDPGSAPMGGLVGEPITRHSVPTNVSDSAFRQLVDGDPKDKDPSHKPKDGDFTGPIQVTESTWCIIRREAVVPADTRYKLEDPAVRKQLQDLMFEAKLKSQMGEVYQELFRSASIENTLSGQVKMANEENHPDHQADGNVKLMSNPSTGKPEAAPSPGDSAPASANIPPPAGLSPETLKKGEAMKRTLKQRPTTSTSPSTPSPAGNSSTTGPN
jgi:foldase protein PrsA